MMLNICSELPDMYIMIAFIGIDFAGAIASSHAFLSLSVSVSSVVGGLRTGCFEEERWNCQQGLRLCISLIYLG